MKVLKIVFVITIAALLSVACGTPSDNSNQAKAPANVNKPASDGAIVTNSNSAPAEKMEGGNSSLGAPKTATPAMDAAKIFADKCAVCHGNDGKGKLKGTPDFTNAEWQKKETDAEFTETIKAGKKPMPPFGGKLSEEQIKSLVAYVRSLAKK